MKTSHNTTCNNFSQIIWLYLERELPEEENKRWEDHLESCIPCLHRLAEAKSILEVYSALPKIDAPESAIQSVVARAQKRPASIWQWVRIALDNLDPHRTWRPALPIAVIGIAVLIFFSSIRGKDIGLTSDPIGIKQAIVWFEGDPFASSERKLVWNIRKIEERQHIAALKLFNLQKARQEQKLAAMKHKSDKLLAALAQWQEGQNSTNKNRILGLTGSHY
jgi:hypothetical protein